MIIRNIPGKVKCPKCGSGNLRKKWSPNTVLAWMSKLFSVPTVKIFEKRCGDCGHEFQIFRK